MRDPWINMGPENEPEPCVYLLPSVRILGRLNAVHGLLVGRELWLIAEPEA